MLQSILNTEQEHIRLRPMQPRDLSKVSALELLCQSYPWPSWFFRRQLRSGASCWVLEKKTELLGFGIVNVVHNMAHIMNICVAPKYRRQGLGRRIMLKLLSVARQQYACYAWLEVRQSNQAAILLYRQLGFHQKKTYLRYYPLRLGRETGIIMAVQLTKKSCATASPH